jgi:branched-chain amino acid transport system substrate-binding protein
MKALGAKRVVAFAENTDYGIGLAKGIGEELKKIAPDVQYKYEVLDRTSKDFLPAILPLRANPPGAVIDVMLPPAAYIMMNQVYEQGIAPSANTYFYDASDVVDYPDFWQNVKEAGKGMLVFGLYHPKMKAPPLGKKVGDAYVQKTKNQPNRLIFQAADCLFVIADAIKRAGTTKSDELIKALEATKLTATRVEITFSKEKSGYKYHQWLDIPHVTFQVTKVGQKIGDTTIVEPVGKPLDTSKVWKPKS